ncbi:hypothetical protein [Streptacidiphilus anmyonensis]|uniref:hypothetical protein n=1 Tax=Streptacidiphilus anmyonensis TaxID=405782 RepID=UPI0005A69DC3|nr:hypothetical protein [Streptacidiphilus anmyonensis]
MDTAATTTRTQSAGELERRKAATLRIRAAGVQDINLCRPAGEAWTWATIPIEQLESLAETSERTVHDGSASAGDSRPQPDLVLEPEPAAPTPEPTEELERRKAAILRIRDSGVLSINLCRRGGGKPWTWATIPIKELEWLAESCEQRTEVQDGSMDRLLEQEAAPQRQPAPHPSRWWRRRRP